MKLHKMVKLTKALYYLRNFVIEATCPCPGAIYMYKIMKKIYVKSEFKAVLLKLTADNQ